MAEQKISSKFPLIKTQRLLQFLFVAGVTIVIFVFLFQKINIHNFLVALRSVDIVLFTLAAGILFLADVVADADKWKIILKALGCPISFGEALFITLGSYPLRALLPFKAGEIIKVVYLKRRKNLKIKYGVSSVLLDKVYNLIGVLVLFASGMIMNTGMIKELYLGMVLASIGNKEKKSSLLAGFKKISLKIYTPVHQVVFTLKEISLSKKTGLLIYSILIQLIRVVAVFFIFKAVGVELYFGVLFFLMPIVVLLSNIPVTTFGLGTREASLVLLFSGYGPLERLLSVGILISVVEFLIPTLIGLFLLPRFIRRIAKKG